MGEGNGRRRYVSAGYCTNAGMRALHYSAWQGNELPVSLLLKANSRVNEAADDGNTALHLTCEHGHLVVVSGGGGWWWWVVVVGGGWWWVVGGGGWWVVVGGGGWWWLVVVG